MMSSKSQKDSEAENSVESGEVEEIKFDVEHEIQGLISTMEGDSGVRRRPSRDSSSMKVDEVSEQDIQLTSRLVDNEDQLLAEANFRAATERKSYCFSKKCIWHFVLISLFVTLIVVGALLVANSNAQASAQSSNSAAAGSTIPPAPSNLADICSISAVLNSGGNADDCRAACAPANCCYSQDNTTISSCYNSFPELCATYMICLSLDSTNEPLPSDTVVPPPVPIATNPPVPIETNPPVPIETNPPVPIETNPPVAESTKKLAIVSPPPDNLSYLCDTSNIQSGLSNMDSCRAGCAPASCCFTSDHSQNCLSYKNNKIQCAKYKKYCLILHPTAAPSTTPSTKPSTKPSTSSKPSSKPSQTPSVYPSNRPSFKPSSKPVTSAPTTLVPISLLPTTLVPVIVNSTEAPVGNETLLDTAAPVDTSAPVGNDTVLSTEAPVATPAPIGNDTALTTEAPVATPAPVGNDTVLSTEAPVATPAPVGNDTALTTEAPVGTAAPVGR